MPTNHYFQDGRMIGEFSEQNLVEDLILEAISIYGLDFYYIPRTIVNLDPLFLEDPLSRFENAYPLEAYLENVNGFGENDILSKFGIQLNDSGVLQVSRRRWEQLVGKYNNIQLPNRPAEGDILYFPKTNSFFEIKKVEAMNPFYQLGKLYTYKLNIELYQYSSEVFDTGVVSIDSPSDIFGTLDTLVNTSETVTEEATPLADNTFLKTAAADVVDWSGSNPFGENS